MENLSRNALPTSIEMLPLQKSNRKHAAQKCLLKKYFCSAAFFALLFFVSCKAQKPHLLVEQSGLDSWTASKAFETFTTNRIQILEFLTASETKARNASAANGTLDALRADLTALGGEHSRSSLETLVKRNNEFSKQMIARRSGKDVAFQGGKNVAENAQAPKASTKFEKRLLEQWDNILAELKFTRTSSARISKLPAGLPPELQKGMERVRKVFGSGAALNHLQELERRVALRMMENGWAERAAQLDAHPTVQKLKERFPNSALNHHHLPPDLKYQVAIEYRKAFLSVLSELLRKERGGFQAEYAFMDDFMTGEEQAGVFVKAMAEGQPVVEFALTNHAHGIFTHQIQAALLQIDKETNPQLWDEGKKVADYYSVFSDKQLLKDLDWSAALKKVTLQSNEALAQETILLFQKIGKLQRDIEAQMTLRKKAMLEAKRFNGKVTKLFFAGKSAEQLEHLSAKPVSYWEKYFITNPTDEVAQLEKEVQELPFDALTKEELEEARSYQIQFKKLWAELKPAYESTENNLNVLQKELLDTQNSFQQTQKAMNDLEVKNSKKFVDVEIVNQKIRRNMAGDDPFQLWVDLFDNESASLSSPQLLNYVIARMFPTLAVASETSGQIFGESPGVARSWASKFDEKTLGRAQRYAD